MQGELYRLLLQSIRESNILPVTSACNSRCIFCSHLQNPPGLKIYTLPRLGKEEILELAQFLDPERKIVIGESVTRIVEGEPFLHPEFLAILESLRRMFPATIIQVTTNGMALTPSTIATLASLGGIQLILSLNSATIAGRRKLMADDDPKVVLEAVCALGDAGVPLEGSIVAMPHLVGWEDLRETIRFLSENGASTIRIFLPGYTRYTRRQWIPPPGLEEELRALVAEERRNIPVPLILEPPGLTDLTPEIIGVIPNSPAQRAGLAAGDVIMAIDGEPVFSRVEAFQRVAAAAAVTLTLRRRGKILQSTLVKEAGSSPGFVMAYDLDPGIFQRFTALLESQVTTRALVATSSLAAPLLEAALARRGADLPQVELVAVPNRTFGGNIRCAGLLLAEDFIAALRPAVESALPRRVFLPGIAFGDRGRDLLGNSYLEVEKALGVPVGIVS